MDVEKSSSSRVSDTRGSAIVGAVELSGAGSEGSRYRLRPGGSCVQQGVQVADELRLQPVSQRLRRNRFPGRTSGPVDCDTHAETPQPKNNNTVAGDVAVMTRQKQKQDKPRLSRDKNKWSMLAIAV